MARCHFMLPAVFLLLAVLWTQTECCGPIRVRIQGSFEKDKDGCKIQGEVEVEAGTTGGSSGRRRKRAINWPTATQTPVLSTASLNPPTITPPTIPPQNSDTCIAFTGCQLFSKRNFDYLDTNSDGVISYAEFLQVYYVQILIENTTCT